MVAMAAPAEHAIPGQEARSPRVLLNARNKNKVQNRYERVLNMVRLGMRSAGLSVPSDSRMVLMHSSLLFHPGYMADSECTRYANTVS